MRFTLTVLAAAFSVVTHASAGEFALKTADAAAPKELGESIRGVLQSKALQLTEDGKPALDLWLRQEVPLKSKPAGANEALNAIGEATLVGAVTVHTASFRDYKDNEIPKGNYTARFVPQPKDGDHLGTADYDSFLVLVAVENDKELNGLSGFRPVVKASGKSTASGHPLILSLRPAAADGTIPRLTEPASEHKAVRVKVPAKAGADEKADLVFDLVYKGHGHIQ